MKKLLSLTLALTLVLVSVLSLAPVALAASMSGAIWTTDGSGNPVDHNIYEYREDVYLNGGPKNNQTQGLPDGPYYVMVTEPNGTVLGWSNPDTPVNVTDGHFENYQLWAIVRTASSGFTATGYDATSNNGGEYKVWISQDPAFPTSASKTDNFKVRYSEEPPPEPSIDVEKYVGIEHCCNCTCSTNWYDADSPDGPPADPNDAIWFKYVITNTGPCDLTNLGLVDSDPVVNAVLSGEVLPDPLPVGADPFEVVIGPFPVEEGQHTNTATATGECDGVPCSDSDDANYYRDSGCGCG
jgi:hypothetical protein